MCGKGVLPTLLLLTLSVAGVTSAQDKPVDVSGTWSGEIKTPVSYSPLSISFRLDQKAGVVTGFAWPGAAQVPIKNVKREVNRLSFDISGPTVIYQFSLTAGVGLLEGDVSADDLGHIWTGKARLTPEKPKENRIK